MPKKGTVKELGGFPTGASVGRIAGVVAIVAVLVGGAALWAVSPRRLGGNDRGASRGATGMRSEHDGLWEARGDRRGDPCSDEGAMRGPSSDVVLSGGDVSVSELQEPMVIRLAHIPASVFGRFLGMVPGFTAEPLIVQLGARKLIVRTHCPADDQRVLELRDRLDVPPASERLAYLRLDYVSPAEAVAHAEAMASERGYVAAVRADENRRGVLIRANDDVIEDLHRIIRELDRPPRQWRVGGVWLVRKGPEREAEALAGGGWFDRPRPARPIGSEPCEPEPMPVVRCWTMAGPVEWYVDALVRTGLWEVVSRPATVVQDSVLSCLSTTRVKQGVELPRRVCVRFERQDDSAGGVCRILSDAAPEESFVMPVIAGQVLMIETRAASSLARMNGEQGTMLLILQPRPLGGGRHPEQ